MNTHAVLCQIVKGTQFQSFNLKFCFKKGAGPQKMLTLTLTTAHKNFNRFLTLLSLHQRDVFLNFLKAKNEDNLLKKAI